MRSGVTLVLTWMMLFLPPAAGLAAARAPMSDPSSQPAASVLQELTLKDGSRLYGFVESETADRIVFRTVAGTVVEVDRAQIASMEAARGRVVGGVYLPPDPNPTRLFFGPSARSLDRGKGYVGVYEFLLPFVQVGLTDRVSIGAGTPLIFGGDSEHPFWLTPKVQVYQGSTLTAAVGVLHFMNVGDGNFGVAYVVATQGGLDNAVTGGIGYAYQRDAEDVDATMIAMIGGERRLGRRVKLITENYFWRGAAIVSVGVRFLGERLSADVGLFTPLASGETFAVPIVNFVWGF